MKQETLEEVAERLYPYEVGYGVFDRNCEIDIERQRFVEGAKCQQERDRDFYFKYIKSEKDFQIPRMANLGINTTGQIFEQMVTSLIHLGERSYSEKEVLHILDTFWDRLDIWYNEGVDENFSLREWFNECELKKKIIMETIEEAALKWFVTANKHDIIFDLGWIKIFEAGAKWQQERSYSQLDVVRILSKYETLSNEDFNKWFEQFKKK